jgi:TetR/AcrR family transcriptional regulator, biofilm operon repressor
MAVDRRNEILIASKRCFSKYGYDKTTLDDIAEIVGVNKVSIYYYYKNKEAIFKEVIELEANEFSDNMKKKVEDITDCKNKILTWIKEGFKYNQTNSILNQLSYDSIKKLTPQLEELKNNSLKKGADYIASILIYHQKKNEIKNCDVNKISWTIQNVIYSMKDSAYLSSKSNVNGLVDFNELINEIIFTISLILDGIMEKK